MPQITLKAARRIALAAQGFSDPPPAGGRADARHLRRVLKRLNLVQLDTVNVLARAHYLPFYARLGDYSQERLDALLYDERHCFEYWGHAASLLLMEHYPLLRFRMAGAKSWHRVERIEAEKPGFVERIFGDVADNGPLTVSDLQETGARIGGWGQSEARVALMHLHAVGRLASIRRRDFSRIYDLPERLIPAAQLNAALPERGLAQRQLLRQAAASLGIASLSDLADYYRLSQRDAGRQLPALLESGELQQVQVQGWTEPAYLWHAARRPRRVAARALISPFDSLIWYRQRLERLWDKYYRIEIYTPEAKRVYGYYVLMYLMDERFVARVDLKADRKTGRLLVQSAWLEPGEQGPAVAAALAETLRGKAAWLGLGDIDVKGKGSLAPELAKALD